MSPSKTTTKITTPTLCVRKQHQTSNAVFLRFFFALGLGVCNLLFSNETAAESVPILHQLIEQAVESDPWLAQNHALESASLSQAELSKFLPDMLISVDLNNVATDDFDFNQEPMSHFKVGIKQKLNRGQTRKLKQKQHQYNAAAMPGFRTYREAEIAMEVTTLLLIINEALLNLSITKQNKAVITDLNSLAEASYKSAFGKTKQEDLVRAQLELTLNQKEQLKFQQQLAAAVAELTILTNTSIPPELLSQKLNKVELSITPLLPSNLDSKLQGDYWYLIANHPHVQALEQKIKASEAEVDIAEQMKKPEFIVSTSYGFRENSPNGLNRADLFSIGVTFDLPGFRKNKTNQLVKQKSYELDAIEAAKNKLIKNMYQQLMILLSKQKSFMDQDQLYSENLIPQYKEMAESTVTAYTYEGGDFTAVLRSQLDSLKAQVELNQLITKIKINTMKINLLLMHSSEQFKSTLKSQGARS